MKVSFLRWIFFSAGMFCSCASTGSKTPVEVPPKLAEKPYYIPTNIEASFRPGLPAPIGSREDKKDLKALHAAQTTRTRVDCDRAQAEALPINPAYAEFFGELGPFSVPLQGEAKEFIVRIWSDASIVSEYFKNKFKWPRAYDVDPTITPCLKKTTSPAFPSGHTIVSRVFALVLSDISPEKRSAYLARADEIANDRIIAGMHRPSEIKAAKALADQIYKELVRSNLFQRDFEKIKTTIVSR